MLPTYTMSDFLIVPNTSLNFTLPWPCLIAMASPDNRAELKPNDFDGRAISLTLVLFLGLWTEVW